MAQDIRQDEEIVYNIIAEVLEISKEGVLKTHFMYRANLSFDQLNKYLYLLLGLGLLNENTENKKSVFNITEKGNEYLKNYYKIRKLLEKEDRGSSSSSSKQLYHY